MAIASFYGDSIVRDSYRADVISEEDMDLIVSLVIAVDNIKDKIKED